MVWMSCWLVRTFPFISTAIALHDSHIPRCRSSGPKWGHRQQNWNGEPAAPDPKPKTKWRVIAVHAGRVVKLPPDPLLRGDSNIVDKSKDPIRRGDPNRTEAIM